MGREQVHVWAGSYDVPRPAARVEDTLARTAALYVQEILPCVLGRSATLVAAHGNSCAPLIMVARNCRRRNLARELATGARSSIGSIATPPWPRSSIWFERIRGWAKALFRCHQREMNKHCHVEWWDTPSGAHSRDPLALPTDFPD